ncbi:hypothetical protein FRB94_009339 [Tulasnella sp. JGI-2019a]|nr:hypothetical protein FRB94_009339 [Tulasnella sp. JGI-2019a]
MAQYGGDRVTVVRGSRVKGPLEDEGGGKRARLSPICLDLMSEVAERRGGKLGSHCLFAKLAQSAHAACLIWPLLTLYPRLDPASFQSPFLSDGAARHIAIPFTPAGTITTIHTSCSLPTINDVNNNHQSLLTPRQSTTFPRRFIYASILAGHHVWQEEADGLKFIFGSYLARKRNCRIFLLCYGAGAITSAFQPKIPFLEGMLSLERASGPLEL